MKSLQRWMLLLALPVLAATHQPSDPLPIGASLPQPDQKLRDISGTMVSFREARKKNGLLVMFSCNTCPVVHKYQTRTNEICRYALSRDIGVILLNANEAQRSEGDGFEEMKAYAHDNGYTWYYVLDRDARMADAFGALRTPEVFLFNPDDRLVYHGAIDDNANGEPEITRKHLAIAIDELVAGKDISTKTTRSVGCSIKRP